eukprot:2002965-Rhodomonas_salina.2
MNPPPGLQHHPLRRPRPSHRRNLSSCYPSKLECRRPGIGAAGRSRFLARSDPSPPAHATVGLSVPPPIPHPQPCPFAAPPALLLSLNPTPRLLPDPYPERQSLESTSARSSTLEPPAERLRLLSGQGPPLAVPHRVIPSQDGENWRKTDGNEPRGAYCPHQAWASCS